MGIRIGVLIPALFVLVAGCATKDWVRDFFGKKEAEIDLRVVAVEGRVGQVGEATKGAHQRADQAFTRAEEADSRLSRLWANRYARELVETLQIHFAFDRWDLNDAAQTALLSLLKDLRQNPKLMVDLEGYADSVGSYPYNIQLSLRRADAVRRFLVEKGVELPRIQWIGFGSLADNGKPEEQAKNRRVTVRLMLPKD